MQANKKINSKYKIKNIKGLNFEIRRIQKIIRRK